FQVNISILMELHVILQLDFLMASTNQSNVNHIINDSFEIAVFKPVFSEIYVLVDAKVLENSPVAVSVQCSTGKELILDNDL
ncbi:unnamed protein product, partial [Brachionus calyciflorus]